MMFDVSCAPALVESMGYTKLHATVAATKPHTTSLPWDVKNSTMKLSQLQLWTWILGERCHLCWQKAVEFRDQTIQKLTRGNING